MHMTNSHAIMIIMGNVTWKARVKNVLNHQYIFQFNFLHLEKQRYLRNF
jgi:hypothetical protein